MTSVCSSSLLPSSSSSRRAILAPHIVLPFPLLVIFHHDRRAQYTQRHERERQRCRKEKPPIMRECDALLREAGEVHAEERLGKTETR